MSTWPAVAPATIHGKTAAGASPRGSVALSDTATGLSQVPPPSVLRENMTTSSLLDTGSMPDQAAYRLPEPSTAMTGKRTLSCKAAISRVVQVAPPFVLL